MIDIMDPCAWDDRARRERERAADDDPITRVQIGQTWAVPTGDGGELQISAWTETYPTLDDGQTAPASYVLLALPRYNIALRLPVPDAQVVGGSLLDHAAAVLAATTAGGTP